MILQPWRPAGEPASPLSPRECDGLLETISEARSILPPEVHLQLPPNLWPLSRLVEALEAGIDDLGGIDAVDVINPAYGQPLPIRLADHLAQAGWRLRPRLCVHQGWLGRLPRSLRGHAETLRQQLECC